MTLSEFEATLENDQPPTGLIPPLQALWLERKGEWESAHRALQDQPDAGGAAWVHAYLHRVEGDLPNARYWYGRADREPVATPLKEEWRQIAEALLSSRQD